ncbi:MAG TPA: glycosyltransferase, partial [Spirochaetales bacterium]|nr:glycosyltransferase [Spirochaetales bacterium]
MVHEKVSRIEILKVPVDIVQPEDLEDVIKSLFDDDRNHHLVLLSMADLMRARRSGEFRTYVNQADLVIPISRSIISTARFIKRREPVRYEPFDF